MCDIHQSDSASGAEVLTTNSEVCQHNYPFLKQQILIGLKV
jgi:hypothetical protein